MREAREVREVREESGSPRIPFHSIRLDRELFGNVSHVGGS